MTFSKQEITYLSLLTAFSLLWFPYLMPKLINTYGNSSPLNQFLIFNLSIYLFLFIFLKSFSMGNTTNMKMSFALLTLFLALDIIMPEYHITQTGELIGGATLSQSTADYVIGQTLQNVGITGQPLFLFVYVIIPILLLMLSAYLLPNFVREL